MIRILVVSLVSLAVVPDNTIAGDKKAAKPIIIDGALPPGDGKTKPAQPRKVKLTQGVTYVIDLVSKDFDAVVRLEDAAGKLLAEDDDGGGMLNARLFFIPPATAEYTLVATCNKPKAGKYRLTVQESNLRAAPLELAAGSASVTGRLTGKSPKSPFSPQNACGFYRVTLTAGTRYVIDLESTDFDAHLTLADASLAFLASDDDSGGRRNARIQFECKQTGEYHLAATGLGQTEGKFELKIRAAE
jgi:hypothetical protein